MPYEMVDPRCYSEIVDASENLWDAQTIEQLLDAELDDSTMYRVELYQEGAI